MSDFLSNTTANLVGTFVGAGLAFLSAWAVSRRERARSELRRLQQVIDRLYRSRAFMPIPIGPVQTNPLNNRQQADFDRVTASIFITRKLIEEAANSLDPKRKSVVILDDMYLATLNYLNSTEINCCDYNNELMRLRAKLVSDEKRLKQLHPKLAFREPGSAVQSDIRYTVPVACPIGGAEEGQGGHPQTRLFDHRAAT